MAIIAIIFGSVLGVFAGLVQFAFLGGTLWQAFVTYVAASFILSTIIGATALMMASTKDDTECPPEVSPDDLENWQDWQTEEEMSGGRHRSAAEHREDDYPTAPAIFRSS